MIKKYTYFNTVCIMLSIFFVFSTLWLWKGVFVNSNQNTSPVPIIEKEEARALIEKPEDKIVREVEDKKIPKEINLPVPFTSQAPEKNWSQPWQDACEEAVVLMLDAYYKDYNLSPLFSKDEILKMVDWEQEKEWGGSIEIAKVQTLHEEYFNKFKVNSESKIISHKSKVIENPTVDLIKEYVANGHPVLVVADGKVLPNPHFQNGGPVYHALIIRGYTEDKFITNDPGTQFGENFTYKYNDLMNAIHDWNGGDVKNGKRVVLVIE